MIKATLFPHFIRIFSAGFLWLFLTLIISLNFYAKTLFSASFEPLTIEAMVHPSSARAHFALAQRFWSMGFLTRAKSELRVAQELSQIAGSGVLGISTNPTTLLTEWESEPTRRQAAYQFWQRAVQEKSDYRDGYMQLASLAYELGRIDVAKQYVSKGEDLDPNNPTIEKLRTLLR